MRARRGERGLGQERQPSWLFLHRRERELTPSDCDRAPGVASAGARHRISRRRQASPKDKSPCQRLRRSDARRRFRRSFWVEVGMEQRFAFDQIADLYKTARPDYPEALIGDVLSYADLTQNDGILEVGCGAGQATKGFAKRGLPILAIDPGPAMVGRARESLAGFGNVAFLETTFEAWPVIPGGFRLIIAAQSWHWISPELRFAKAAETLSPDGSLAVFGHVPVGLPASILTRFRDIYWSCPHWWCSK
jgi:SAM-dependent methyltransferase